MSKIYLKKIIHGGVLLVAFLLVGTPLYAATVKGKVLDENKEALIGAHVVIEDHTKHDLVGLDGSYSISGLDVGTYKFKISFIGFQSQERTITISNANEVLTANFTMVNDDKVLNEVVVKGKSPAGSETEARMIERSSSSTVNVVSAKSIALSPDVSVANVIQRVSGLSVERSASGDPQYAVVRGMDKRYSYTLVNGVKIPSPDNKNRYIPLDIFPAALLDRLEVYKSLTADLEGDAIGGGINMVMKGAPQIFEFRGDLQIGYNRSNMLNGFDKYDASKANRKSPRELYGSDYQAQPDDFTKKNLVTENVKPLPDIIASMSVGDRFFNNKLGIMLGGSFQNSYRGSETIWFDEATERFGSNRPSLYGMDERLYSTQQQRTAGHANLDYRISDNHDLSLYTGYYILNNHEVRESHYTHLDGRGYDSNLGTATLEFDTRVRSTYRDILNTTLKGKHKVLRPLSLEWTAVYSKATSNRPDNSKFLRVGAMKDFMMEPEAVNRRNPRQWENNSDLDYTGYMNLILQPESWGNTLVKIGGMYRTKDRDNFLNRYRFDPSPGRQVKGVDWETFEDVTWSVVNPAGSASDELNYLAHEDILAYYALTKIEINKLEANVGVRVEETDQGYKLKSPKTGQTPDSAQVYTDVLPSLSLKYKANDHMNLRFTYYKAISRPGFFEIVPYRIISDDFDEIGNPSLKRVKADNLDLRIEYFPNSSDQILAGVFYKKIVDPIEYAVVFHGVRNEPVIQANNFGTAYNMGFELDFTKFFNKIGIKGNYTYTHSRISSSKAYATRVDPDDPTSDITIRNKDQTRPLQGQANHIGNFSLLYKDLKKGLEAQLSLSITGEKLDVISVYLDNDRYSQPIALLDLSIEKKVSRRVDVFFKAINLLDSPYKVYIKRPIYLPPGDPIIYPYQHAPESKTLVRKDRYYQSARLGLRVNF